jgi:hypothetical protein
MLDKKMLKAMMADGDDSMMKSKLKAKMDVLKELMEMADESETAGLMDDMQKVTVAAPDKESLVEGLEKAEEVVEGDMPMMDPMMDDEEDEDEEDEAE